MRIQDMDQTESVAWRSTPPLEPPSTPASPSVEAGAPYQFVRVKYLCCCGIKELTGIAYQPPKQVIQDFCFQRTAPDIIAPGYESRPDVEAQRAREVLTNNKFGCAFVLFTQAYLRDTGIGYGDTLKSYIEEQSLGEVSVAGKERNPNSGNIVTIYLWKVDHAALFTWWEKNPVSAVHKKRLLETWKQWKAAHLL